jgi:hypothetical protein
MMRAVLEVPPCRQHAEPIAAAEHMYFQANHGGSLVFMLSACSDSVCE